MKNILNFLQPISKDRRGGIDRICFVSAKFGPLMIFLKRWFAYNKITQGEMHEYKEEAGA